MLGMASFSDHIRDICSILETQEIPNENPQKDYAAIYLKNYIRNTIAAKDTDKKASKVRKLAFC